MQVSLKHLLSFALLWLTSLVVSYAYAVQPAFHAAEPRVNAVHSYETTVQAASSPWGDPVSTPQIYDYESLPLFECAPDIRSASPHALCAYERISSFLAAESEVTVYRAFGGDARAQGFSWTTVDPRTVSNFRNAAGLPSGGASGATNTADFMIQGRARLSDVMKFKSADPLDGNIGGLRELIIDPKNVRINDFSILKP